MQKISLLIISLLFCASAAGIEIDAGPDRIVCEGQSITLEAVVSDGTASTICWFDADTYIEGVTPPLFIGATYSFTQTETKSYRVIGKDEFGVAECSDIVTVVLPSLSLQEVSFHNNYRIEQDPPANGFFDAPQYLNIELPILVSYPICYSANSNLQVSASITFPEYILFETNDLNNIINNMKIKAKYTPPPLVPDQTIIEIPATNITLSNNGTINLAATSTTAPFANMVNYVEEFIIVWEISFDSGNSWCEIGESNNELYVTLDTPNNGFGASKLFHTTLHYACINAIGLNDADEIVDAIYSEFADQEVRKLGSTTPLQYWGNSVSVLDCNDVRSFLAEGDARCGVWSRFFIDMIRIHGFDAQRTEIKVTENKALTAESHENLTALSNLIGYDYIFLPQAPNTATAFFNVKHWNIEPTTTIEDFYDLEDDDPQTTPLDFITKDGEGNIVDLIGIEGQGNNNPLSLFSDHSIVFYNNKYYDPSYGTLYDNGTPDNTSDDIPFPSLLAWEDAAIDGFSSIICLSQSTNQLCTFASNQKKLWVEQLNNYGSLDMVEEIFLGY